MTETLELAKDRWNKASPESRVETLRYLELHVAFCYRLWTDLPDWIQSELYHDEVDRLEEFASKHQEAYQEVA